MLHILPILTQSSIEFSSQFISCPRFQKRKREKWGMKTGPYVVLPILGPTSLRGVVGQILDLPSSVAKLPLKNILSFQFIINYLKIVYNPIKIKKNYKLIC